MGAEGAARRWLPLFVGLALIASWWLSLIVLLDTPWLDLTPPKVAVLAGGAVLLVARPWHGLSWRDIGAGLPVVAFLGWFPLAALLRGTIEDFKTAAAYAVFAGLAAAAAYFAARFERQRAARVVALVVLGAIVVAFAASVLERLTYPPPGQADPLEWLWSFFRPRTGFDDPRLGYIEPPPLHSPTGEPGVIRATGFFVQTNYQAFFAVLAVPLAIVVLTDALRTRRSLRAALAAALVAAGLLTAFWTYARVGLLAIGAVAVAALVVDWLAVWARRRPAARSSLRPTVAGLALVVLVLGGSLLGDGVGLSRLTGTTLGDSPSAEEPLPGDPPESVAERAARSAEIRFKLQRTAFEMITSDPRAALVGPGLAAYETAVHHPASPRRIPEAVGIRDPNSLWLTITLAGGVMGLGLLIVLLGVLGVRLWRTLRRPARYEPATTAWPRLVVLWLAAWLPVWAIVQVFGTNPFNTAESIIFGTLVGTGLGLTAKLPPAGQEPSGDLDQA